MHLSTYQSELDAIQHASEQLKRIFESFQDQPLLFLSSGGSVLALLEYIPQNLLSKRLTVSTLDDRFSHKPSANTFAQLSATSFFERAKAAGARVIDTTPQMNETLEQFGRRIDATFKQWQQEHETGVVAATMGMGADGHTSGIMPYPNEPEEFDALFCRTDAWVVGYNAGNKNEIPDRATTTIPFLTGHVRHAVMLIMGKEKKSAFERLCAMEGSICKTPARVVHDMNDVQIFTTLA